MDWKVSAFNPTVGNLKEVTISAKNYYNACAKYAELMKLPSNWRVSYKFSAHDTNPGQVGRKWKW